MNKNAIGVGIAVVVVLGLGIYAFTKPAQAPVTNQNENGTSTTTATYTQADVATHSDGSNCYTIIAGSVYDLTAWIGQHPGGEQAILSLCGKDGTEAFMGQHGGGKRQENVLATYKIGTLEQ